MLDTIGSRASAETSTNERGPRANPRAQSVMSTWLDTSVCPKRAETINR